MPESTWRPATALGGGPYATEYRGGGSTGGTLTPVVPRRWTGRITTNATGTALVSLPVGLFSEVWSVRADVIDSSTTYRVGKLLAATATALSVQVFEAWTLPTMGGGMTMRKSTVAVPVLVQVTGAPGSAW